MKKWKKIDCVKMKDEIQTELLKKRQGLNDREVETEIRQKLEHSRSPVARFWREAYSKRKAA